MKRALFVTLLLAACSSEPQAPEPGPKGGPPPIPPYQMRAEAPAKGGEALFSNKCGACHLAGGMGTNLLTKQMMMAKRPPEQGLLVNRDDLAPDYVKAVVRNGKLAMPRLTQVDVTDDELDAIASYLGKAKS